MEESEDDEEYYNDIKDCYEEIEMDICIDSIKVNELPQCGMLIIGQNRPTPLCERCYRVFGNPFKISKDMLKDLTRGSAKSSINLAGNEDIYDIEDAEDYYEDNYDEDEEEF